MSEKKSAKDYVVCLLLCFFLGTFGVHRFYVGKICTGVLMILTVGGFGIWNVIDFVVIVLGRFTDNKGKFIRQS